MSQQQNAHPSAQEDRIILALSAYYQGKFRSLRRAAEAYNVPRSTLSSRHHGAIYRPDSRSAQHKLTGTEEQAIVFYVLDIVSRGFAPRLCEVADMANKLVTARGGPPVGKNWAVRFTRRSDALKSAFNRARDRRRMPREDPEVVNAWFQLVQDTVAKYGIVDDDIHNFDDTSFQMGAIGSVRVVTGSERRTRPQLVQTGSGEWVTVFHSICAAGYVAPPFIVYKGRVPISEWHQETDIPHDWKLSVLENGWTNNTLGLEWLKHFDTHTRARQKGSYRLLILDGHESHLNQDFKDYCAEHKILTLCTPARLSHVLQPLDVVCFAPLKLNYSQRVGDMARRSAFHIDRHAFIPAFKDAFFDVFTPDNCQEAFRGSGLVPIDAQVALDRLRVPLPTPSPGPLPETPWPSETLSDSPEAGPPSRPVDEAVIMQPPMTAHSGFSQVVEGAEMILQQIALQAARIRELEEQLAAATRRASRKRKRPATARVPEHHGTAAAAPPPPRRQCGTCGHTGHNARTCQINTERPPGPDERMI